MSQIMDFSCIFVVNDLDKNLYSKFIKMRDENKINSELDSFILTVVF